uniref:Protein Nef n=1 Tax=Human immunodeficiency virus type 1 TaxID=11676 RepID=A0T3A5_HV1|nr:nef protein [Human immunodeficiency virus 1]
MGGLWSKRRAAASWFKTRERMEKTEPAEPAAVGVGAASRDLEKHGAITSSNTAATNAATRPMTYKAALDLSHFLKEKGGLDGLIYSQKRADILDLWVYHTQGFFPDWQNYTPGPGIRYPLCFGWCFELVPVDPDKVEEANEGDTNCLLHPMGLHGMDDPEKEVLVWKFNSRLAFHHKAREQHPEYYKDC